MKMNDQEEYILDTTRIFAAYKATDYEWRDTMTEKKKFLWFERTTSSYEKYEAAYQIKIDFGDSSHSLSYNTREVRDSDYERLVKATALDSQ